MINLHDLRTNHPFILKYVKEVYTRELTETMDFKSCSQCNCPRIAFSSWHSKLGLFLKRWCYVCTDYIYFSKLAAARALVRDSRNHMEKCIKVNGKDSSDIKHYNTVSLKDRNVFLNKFHDNDLTLHSWQYPSLTVTPLMLNMLYNPKLDYCDWFTLINSADAQLDMLYKQHELTQSNRFRVIMTLSVNVGFYVVREMIERRMLGMTNKATKQHLPKNTQSLMEFIKRFPNKYCLSTIAFVTCTAYSAALLLSKLLIKLEVENRERGVLPR
jgi:hypothetical protein